MKGGDLGGANAPQANERRGPPRLVILIGVIVAGYLGLFVLSRQLSRSLISSATLQLVDASGNAIQGIETWVEWNEPALVFDGLTLPPSDAQGMVDLSLLQEKNAVLGRFWLRPILPGAHPGARELETTTILQLPSIGTFVVQLRDSSGQPWRDTSTPNMTVSLGATRQQRSNFDANGHAEFAMVACAPQQLYLQLQGYHIGYEELKGIEGPSTAGATREHSITIPNDAPRLIGTITGPNARPIQDEFALRVNGTGSTRHGWKVTTDAHGRFQFLLARNPSGGKLQLLHKKHGHIEVTVPAAKGPTHDVGILVTPL